MAFMGRSTRLAGCSFLSVQHMKVSPLLKVIIEEEKDCRKFWKVL